jgi:hypothetical protein
MHSPLFFDEVNNKLLHILEATFSGPYHGLEAVRSVLLDHGIDIPMIYDIDQEDDEFTVKIDDDLYLYVVYVTVELGMVHFHAEITDEEGLQEILSEV